MAHTYKMTTWQAGSKKWYTNDVTNLAGASAKWYAPMRILNISVEEYIELLITYKAKGLRYCARTDYLGFYFETEKDAKAFCSYINKAARKRNFCCV